MHETELTEEKQTQLDELAAFAGGDDVAEDEGQFIPSDAPDPVNPQEFPVYEMLCMTLQMASSVVESRMAAAGIPDQGLKPEEINAIAMPAAACLDKYAPAATQIGVEGALLIGLVSVAAPRYMAVNQARLEAQKKSDGGTNGDQRES